MIQIRHNELDNLVKKHYEKLKGKIKHFPSSCKYSLEEVISSKPEKLHEIAMEYKDDPSFNFMKNLYKNFTNKDKNEYNAYDLVKSLNINSCPYCNRNYTFTAVRNGRILRPDLDHFYDKDTYPILALSFYNLIPSCIECNRTVKGTEHFCIDTHIHPYIDSLNNYAKFKLNIQNSSFYYDEKGFELEFRSEDTKAQKNIDDLKLEEIYNEGYKSVVLDLIQKAEIYNDSYIDELYSKYEGTLFKNREDLLRLVSCGYINDEDINKRPLSKLIKDISKELDLI